MPDQRYGIRNRLAQLAALPEWPAVAGGVPGAEAEPADTPPRGDRHGSGAAAPDPRVRQSDHDGARRDRARSGPAYPAGPALALHGPSLDAAWAATAAVTAAYSPAIARASADAGSDAAEVMQRAAESGDAHAIKFADAAIEAYGFGKDPALLAAADHATALIGD